MSRDVFIAIALGLIAAIVFVSATTGPVVMKIALFLLTSLPLMLAGLGWGTQAVVVAGLSGAALLAYFGLTVAAIFLASQALPAAVLTYLARLSRPVGTDDAPAAQAAPREWYPAGRIVIVAGGLAALVAAVASLIAQPLADELKTSFATALEQATVSTNLTGPGGVPFTPEQIASLAAKLYAMIPALSAMAWMGGLLTSLWLAAHVMRSSGQLARPWPDLAGLVFPAGSMLAFSAAALAALGDGSLAITGRALFGALMLAYVLLGLAIVHYITRGQSWRTPALAMLYATLLFMSGLPLIPLLILGLSDRLFDLRARFGGPPAATPSNTSP